MIPHTFASPRLMTVQVSVDELFTNLAGVLGPHARNANRRGLSLAAGWLRDQERKAWHRVRVRRASVNTWRYADAGTEENTGALAHVFHGSWEERGKLAGRQEFKFAKKLKRLRRKREYSIRKDAAKALRVKSTSVEVGKPLQHMRSATHGGTTGAKGTGPRLHARGSAGSRGKGKSLNAAIAVWSKERKGDEANTGWIDASVTFMDYTNQHAARYAHLLESGHVIRHPGKGMRPVGYFSGKYPVKKTFERGASTMVRMWSGYMLQSVKMLDQGNAQWFKHSAFTGTEGRRRLRKLTMKLGKG